MHNRRNRRRWINRRAEKRQPLVAVTPACRRHIACGPEDQCHSQDKPQQGKRSPCFHFNESSCAIAPCQQREQVPWHLRIVESSLTSPHILIPHAATMIQTSGKSANRTSSLLVPRRPLATPRKPIPHGGQFRWHPIQLTIQCRRLSTFSPRHTRPHRSDLLVESNHHEPGGSSSPAPRKNATFTCLRRTKMNLDIRFLA